MHFCSCRLFSQDTLVEGTAAWGVQVERVEVMDDSIPEHLLSISSLSTWISESTCITFHQVKDVRVPEQLMRAMAAEAEAARNARAKVKRRMRMR